LDNTVLSNFSLVRRSDLIGLIWGDAVGTTAAVRIEHEAGVAAGRLPAGDWQDLPTFGMTADELAIANALPGRLGAGERTCLAVALYRGGLLVTDDRDARTLAERKGLAVSGTLGVLLRAVRRGYLAHETANVLLEEMVAGGYRSPVASLDELLGGSEADGG
jgi:predicted nucleic acid-binding protein